jgi:hypothetical protein
MERIFWVTCPRCHGRFYCDYQLRFQEIKLICPHCEHQFFDKESPHMDERN